MRRLALYVALASIILWPLTLTAQNVKPVSKPQLKSIEVKHFTKADGVQLSPNFQKVFYASFLAEMQRLNVADQTVEDGTPVVDTDKPHAFIPHFMVLEGTFMNVQEGQEKNGKFEDGYVTISVLTFRRDADKTDKSAETTKFKIPLTASLQNNEQKAAEAAGVQLADEFRKKWYPDRKISNWCC
jgi:hypothetical protein